MYEHNFFYRTRNIINDKFYYGIHSTNNLDDGYIGSGLNLKSAIKKYERKNFKREILLFFESRKKSFDYEEKFLTEDILSNPMCYNISPGGNRGGDTSGMVNTKDSKTGKHFFISINDSRYISGKLIPVMKGFLMVKDLRGKNQKVRVDDERYLNGELTQIWKRPKESKNKKTWTLTDEIKEKIRKSRMGQSLSEETKKKISESQKHHTHQVGKKHSHYGKKWIKNIENKERLLINKKEINKYLALGWVLGRKISDK